MSEDNLYCANCRHHWYGTPSAGEEPEHFGTRLAPFDIVTGLPSGTGANLRKCRDERYSANLRDCGRSGYFWQSKPKAP